MHLGSWLYLLLPIMALVVAEGFPADKVATKNKKKCTSDKGKCVPMNTCAGKVINLQCGKDEVCCADGKIYCSYKPGDFPKFPPLILDSTENIVLPEGEKQIFEIEEGVSFTLACPGLNNKFRNFKKEEISVECQKKGGHIIYKTKKYLMANFGCKKEIRGIGQMTKDKKQNNVDCEVGLIKGIEFEIGFDVFKGKPLHVLITGCFDLELRTTIWTKHTIQGMNLLARQKYGKTRYFVQDSGFFTKGMKLVDIYPKKQQIKLIKHLGLSEDIINSRNEWFLAKGHMAPISDFVIMAEMEVTNRYINVLPQWQAINNGNWQRLEREIQRLATDKQTDVEVTTGGFGIQTFIKDTPNNKPVKLFLGEVKNKYVEEVPVPVFTWKVVRIGDKGVAFVVINDPFLYEKPELVCDEDVCDKLNGFYINHYERHQLCKGYTYCCNVKDLQDKKIVPELETKIVALLDDWN